MLRYWERDWPGALRELERSLALNPGQAMTRAWYSIILSGAGQRAAALREARRAYELDPFAVVVAGNLAGQCYVVRDDACANEITRRLTNLGGYAYAYTRLAKMQAQRGQPDSAFAALRTAMGIERRPERLLADLAYVQAKAGRTAEARETLRRAEGSGSEPFDIACAFAALREPDSVFAWFDRTPWHWAQRGSLDDPIFDEVRSDPRFAALRARILREMGVR
jgi:tetratricopeptide (TPR) repeat protein